MVRRRLTVILLALSLTANLGFIAGYLYTEHRSAKIMKTGQAVELVVQSLQLNDDQKVLFRRLKKKAGRIKRAYHREMQRSREQLWQQLLIEQDREKSIRQTNRLIRIMERNRAEYQQQIRDIVLEFILSTCNRGKTVERALFMMTTEYSEPSAPIMPPGGFLIIGENSMKMYCVTAVLFVSLLCLSALCLGGSVHGSGGVKGKGWAQGSGVARASGTASGTGVVIYRDGNNQVHYRKGTGTVSGRGIVIGSGSVTGRGKAVGHGRAGGKGKYRR